MTKSLSLLALASVLAAGAAGAQDGEVEPGWSNTAEVSLVATGGNAEAETLGLDDTLTWRRGRSLVKLSAGALRAESTTRTRAAIGVPGAFAVREEKRTEVTAERYHLRARWDRDVSKRLFWFVRGGWLRNEFAGIRRRLIAAAGVGTIWFEREDASLRTDYGVSWTEERGLVGSAGDRSFAGLSASSDYHRRLTATTVYDNELALELNLDDTSDGRADLVQSLAVSINSRLALKVSLELLYDRQPALERIPLLAPDGTATGDTVAVPLEKLDRVLTLALVVDF